MDTKKSIHRWKEEKWGQGWEVCEIKCRACETKFIPLARAGTGGASAGGRFQEDVSGRGAEGSASERWQKRHKSDGHPKVPRNTKQKKDRARAGVATLERGSQSGRLFSNNLPRRRGRRAAGGGGVRRVAVFRQRRRRWRRWCRWRRRGPTAVGCLPLLESGRRAHTTDTIAAINTGEQPLTSPTGGPILYFISKLIPREQIYCKKEVKKYIFSAHGPPARPPSPLSACHSIHLTYLC